MNDNIHKAKQLLDDAVMNGIVSNAIELKNALATLIDELELVSEFDSLKLLLNSNEWPQAVYTTQIADENSDKDKRERAEGIIDIILPPVDGKKFLDFGCGEGHVVACVAGTASVSVGYDIVQDSKSGFDWNNESGNFFLTTDFDSVKNKGPYDIILIYDVLDHAQESTPKEILLKAASVLAEGGKIYLRTHPWCSRHGGHAYRKINKAFVHLVFTEEELRSMGVDFIPNMRVMKPIDTYNSWIKDAGLKTATQQELDLQDVEPFFKNNPIVSRRILRSFGIKEWAETPNWQMSQCFHDLVLEKE